MSCNAGDIIMVINLNDKNTYLEAINETGNSQLKEKPVLENVLEIDGGWQQIWRFIKS